MIYLQRKLRAKYSGDKKYKPEQMPEGKYLPVIGWTTQRRLVIKGQKQEYVDQPFLLIIGDNGVLLEVIMFNCKVMIDDRSEIDMATMSQLLRNITIIGKELCEKFTGIHVESDDQQLQEETGEGKENTPVEPV